jgi:hypothetical protein
MTPANLETELRRHVERSLPGYRAFCATVDLLGVTRMLEDDPEEAMNRLNGLQRSFADATLLFPGDAQERACFAGDSWFIVREVQPGADEPALWKVFCGRMFALASIAAEIEYDLGNPGVRVIASRGRLVQIAEPDRWRGHSTSHQTRNWFVLTGATEALVKCMAAERAGSHNGFQWGYFWHETVEHDLEYAGTPLVQIDPHAYGDEHVYPRIYDEMCSRAKNRVNLPEAFLTK